MFDGDATKRNPRSGRTHHQVARQVGDRIATPDTCLVMQSVVTVLPQRNLRNKTMSLS